MLGTRLGYESKVFLKLHLNFNTGLISYDIFPYAIHLIYRAIKFGALNVKLWICCQIKTLKFISDIQADSDELTKFWSYFSVKSQRPKK